MAIKVLLVEDDRVLRQALGDTLEIGGFAYQAVGSAEEALDVVLDDAFSLVVSDVNMPGMDGHQLLSQLRRQQPQLPVLLMTAHAAVERAVEAMRQGAADYLVKPFEPKALLSLVERHAAGRVTGEEGPVACEPASRQLLEPGRPGGAQRLDRADFRRVRYWQGSAGALHSPAVAPCRAALRRDQLCGDPRQYA